MILILGLMCSIYLIYLILGSNKTSQQLSRVSSLVILITLFWLIDMKMHWQGEIIFMDGLCLINDLRLTSEIFIMSLSLIIFLILGLQNIKSELYLIMLGNLIGISYLLTSHDWIITITSWELLNLSLYLLVTMQISNKGASLSAGLKYFLLSALTTAFLLMGVALIYGQTGTTHMDILNSFSYYFNSNDISLSTLENLPKFSSIFLPYILIFITFSFKLGAAPFHNWAPDLYDSIPTPIVMWMAIIPKVSLLLFIISLSTLLLPDINPLIIFISLFSLLIGSVGLGSQWRIKRFFAYSAISHLGYLLLAYLSLSFDSYLYYLFLYAITSLLFFSILIALQSSYQYELQSIKQLSGFFLLNPSLSLAFTLCIFSLAGIPPLAGFFAKLQILQALLYNSSFYISLFIVFTSVISTANYISLIKISNLDLPLYPITINVTPFLSYVISILSTLLLFYILKPNLLLTLITSLLCI